MGSDNLTFGDLRLVLGRRELARNGARVPLRSPRRDRVQGRADVEHLARRRGRGERSEQAGLKPDSPLPARIAALNVAVNDIGGSAGDFVRELLRRGGLGERDAVLINISSRPGRLAALKAKRIGALVGYAPGPETAMIEGYGEILIDSATDIPEIKTIEYIMYFVGRA